jgi:hypothetical protein
MSTALALALLALAAAQELEASPFVELFERDRIAAQAKLDAPRPDLLAVPLPMLERETLDAQLLWATLTDPNTPYLEQRARALRVGQRLPLELLPDLLVARQQLEREATAHHWSLRAHPMSSVAWPWEAPRAADFERVRKVLGRDWQLPAETAAHPITFEEEASAPWPWRVQQTLDTLFHTSAPRGDRGDYARRWLDAAMQLPIATDDEARRFLSAAMVCTHFKTIDVLARCYAIGVLERLAESSYFLANHLGSTSRLLAGERERQACRVLAHELLQHGDQRTRDQTAYQLPSLVEFLDETSHVQRAPIPAGAVLLACELALDPGSGHEWQRLYVYAFSVAECFEETPIAVDRRMDPDSPAVAESLAAFAAWFDGARPQLEGLALRQARADRAVRAELIRLAEDR